MRLFEDIIDSAEPLQDVRSASSVVSDDIEPYIMTDDINMEPDDTDMDQKLFIFTEFIGKEVEKKANILHSILEASLVISEYTTIYVWTDKEKFSQFVVRFDFIENPDYSNVIKFMVSVNNIFYKKSFQYGQMYIESGQHDIHLRSILNFVLNNKRQSLFTMIKNIRKDVLDYKQKYSQDIIYDLNRMKQSESVIKIISMVYKDQTFVPERDNDLLTAIQEFDIFEIKS